jgi:trehalose 2-sulfotransferase
VPTRSVLICCVPRSGSWLLAEALEWTGRCGRPREYFRPDYVPRYAAEWGLGPAYSFAAFLGAARRAGTTANGIFSAKLHWGQYESLRPRLQALPGGSGRSDAELLAGAFVDPSFVHLRRLDTAAQAVSLYRAVHLDVWWSLDGEDPVGGAGRLPTELDLDHVARLEAAIVEGDRAWCRCFAEAGVEPVSVTYEELSASYGPTVARVLGELGVAADPPPSPPRLRKQADDLSREWVATYLAHRGSTP